MPRFPTLQLPSPPAALRRYHSLLQKDRDRWNADPLPPKQFSLRALHLPGHKTDTTDTVFTGSTAYWRNCRNCSKEPNCLQPAQTQAIITEV
jgi:hypothetical protein